ncbi:hypothetical protein B0H10DRAFT_1346840 [Mycena sp. CBHHK59/15]|nr:hypothetical protein B0H10DRAFT_1346840 [Mycena sp. CBHHK59/15]
MESSVSFEELEQSSEIVYPRSSGPRVGYAFNSNMATPASYLPYPSFAEMPFMPPIIPSGGLPVPVTSIRPSKFSLSLDLTLTVALIVTSLIFDSIPRQVYLHFLLRIPSLYFSRVARIFEDAQLSLPDIKRMARATAEQWNAKESPSGPLMFLAHPDQMPLPRSLLNFRSSWEGFIDALMRE